MGLNLGIRALGVVDVPRMANTPSGLSVYPFDLNDATFTAGMAKRAGEAGVFDAAPIIQGFADGTGTVDDVITYNRGEFLGNVLGYAHAFVNAYQGTILGWITPEIASGAVQTGYAYLWYGSANYWIAYDFDNSRFEVTIGGVSVTAAQALVAGTSYFVAFSWDTLRTLDGTNSIRISINDSHTYGGTGLTASAPDTSQYLGGDGAGNAVNAILEGMFVYHRVLYDGAYGTPPLDGADELAAMYAAGAGLDPAQVTGAWDVGLCVPTDSSEGAIVTGTGEAWSLSPASGVLDVYLMSDGGLPGTPYAVEFNGTSTYIDCGSGATLDDIPSGADMTVGMWIRFDGAGSSGGVWPIVKGETDGWQLRYAASTDRLWVVIFTDGTTGQALVEASAFGLDTFLDGKWHYVVFYYDDAAGAGSRLAYISVDGRWASAYVTQISSTGNYLSDAARNLNIGRRSNGNNYHEGGIAWAALWSDDHHVAGTDFIPPRAAPTPGGNLVECWHMDEGTGATAAAQVTTPANDGTISNGAWSAIWEQESTPVVPQSLEFDGSAAGTRINYGSGANIDDLPNGAFTFEGWFCLDDLSSAHMTLGVKGNATNGWAVLWNQASAGIQVVFFYGGTNINETIAAPGVLVGVWFHLAVTYDQGGDRKAYVWINGILAGSTSASVGAYVTDAALDLFVSTNTSWPPGYGTIDGHVGWHRLSDSVRYTANFVPAARSNPPANDANAHLLVNMTDGAGTTATDTSGNAYNGTITMGSGQWLNTPDMEVESPGERAYPWGYAIGSDGADDGITIIDAADVVAETDYVIRASLSIGMSGRALPYLEIYDNIGAAQIGADFIGPKMTGTHDGGAAAASLTDSTARWVQNLAGWTVYNITDASSATIISNTQTNIVATLAGGGSNDWNAGESYLIRPPSNRSYSQHPWQETYVIRTPAACTSIDVKVLNAAGEGIMHIHQVEVYESLIDNGDHESLDGGFPAAPELITGWTNNNLDAGDTEPEAATIHAGAQSLEWNTGASGEGMWAFAGAVTTQGNYVALGYWHYGDGVGLPNRQISWAESGGVGRMVPHSDASVVSVLAPVATRWSHVVSVWRRAGAANNFWGFAAGTSATGDRWTDDAYAILLSSASLTVTPASQANSLEGTGIRVDGLDTLTVPAAEHRMRARSGAIRFRATPRHSLADAQALGQSDEYLLDLTENANNYLRVYRTTNTLTLEVNQQGAGAVTDTDATAWAANTEVLIEVGNTGGRIYVKRDGVYVCELTGLLGFTGDFTAVARFGHDATPEHELDGVIAPP